MSAQDTITKALEAFNRHDAEAFAALYDGGAIALDPQYEQPLKGKEAIRKDMADFFMSFPDAQATLLSVLGNGASAASEMEVVGTHKGDIVTPGGTVPATNRSVKFRIGRFVTVNGQDRITECRRYFDLAGVLGQLGVS